MEENSLRINFFNADICATVLFHDENSCFFFKEAENPKTPFPPQMGNLSIQVRGSEGTHWR